jgi:signal transduction histidine kinase
MTLAILQGTTIQNDDHTLDTAATSDLGPGRHAFLDAARTIGLQCEAIFGAEAGFVAWNTASTGSFDVSYLDAGRFQLDDDSKVPPEPPSLPLPSPLPPPLRRLAGRAARTRRPAFSNALPGWDSSKSNGNRPAKIRNAVVAPILMGEGGVAGLVGLLDKPGGFSRSDGKLAEALAEMAAAAMGRSLSLNRMDQSRRRLKKQLQDGVDLSLAAESRATVIAEALREATIALTRSLDRETVLATLLERLGRMVPFDRASVMLIEEAQRVSVRAIFDGQQILRLLPEARTNFDPAEHPVVDAILKTGMPLMIPDIRTRADWSLPTDCLTEICWMGVPLFARGSVAGLVSLSKSEAGYFNEEHLKLAEAMSSQASVAVENAILYEQMSASTARMQTLSRRLVDVQETERREIARELHDEAGQALVSLRLGLRLMERELEQGENVRERVAELVERTDAVIENLHRLAADLRPVSLDHVGLDAALRQYVETAIASPSIMVRYKARGFSAQRLPARVETALFRIAQEAMTNVARHADASRVDLLVEHRGDRVQLIVEDNGIGFDSARVWDGDQIGLIGMRERAEGLGGTLTIETASGKGTTIVVEVPSADPNPDR